MIVFSREVFVCKCSTHVKPSDEAPHDLASEMRFVKGGEAEIALLDPEHHNAEHVADFRARLARGEHWMVGIVDVERANRIVTYTWLHTRPVCDYPYLPGCSFNLAKDVGYGYDAWTPPDLRGGGLRRHAFVEELRILESKGIAWEASYFVKHQLDGATRSLSRVGIDIVPLWRVTLQRDKSLAAEKLAKDDSSTTPAFARGTASP
jgi:hypothetical protein